MNMRKIWNDTTFWLGLSKTEHWEKERTEEERKRDAERQAAWNATPWKDEGLSRQEWEAQGNVDKHSAVRAQMDADFDAKTARCVEIRRREKANLEKNIADFDAKLKAEKEVKLEAREASIRISEGWTW